MQDFSLPTQFSFGSQRGRGEDQPGGPESSQKYTEPQIADFKTGKCHSVPGSMSKGTSPCPIVLMLGGSAPQHCYP